MKKELETRAISAEARRLVDIPRPYYYELNLPKEKILVLEAGIVLGLGKKDKHLLVGAEKTKVIKFANSDNSEFIYPIDGEEDLRGQFAVLPIRLRTAHNGFYVGEDYKISYSADSERLFKIESTEEVRHAYTSNGDHYAALLSFLITRKREN